MKIMDGRKVAALTLRAKRPDIVEASSFAQSSRWEPEHKSFF